MKHFTPVALMAAALLLTLGCSGSNPSDEPQRSAPQTDGLSKQSLEISNRSDRSSNDAAEIRPAIIQENPPTTLPAAIPERPLGSTRRKTSSGGSFSRTDLTGSSKRMPYAPKASLTIKAPSSKAPSSGNPLTTGIRSKPILKTVQPPRETNEPTHLPLRLGDPRGEQPRASVAPDLSSSETRSTRSRAPLGGNRLANSAVSEVDAQGFSKVKVFYGTDRQSIDATSVDWPNFAARFILPCVLAALTSMMLLTYRLGYRTRALVCATMMGIAITMGTLLWASYQTIGDFETTARTGRHYGNERGELELGVCEVTIPREHEVGVLEAPSIWRLEFKQDSKRHIVLREAKRLESDDFFSQVQQRVNRSPRKDLFVFIHGFNVNFEKAARRTAQMAFDLDFEGAPMFFSWPSQGGALKYTIDKVNSKWAARHIKEFLQDVAARSGAEQIHLIAHSMGNLALTDALRSLADEMQDGPMFSEVILTAPDLDAEIFKRDIAPAIMRTAKRVTLYASSNDQALKLSKQINGHPRAGDSGAGLVVLPGMDTIDVSAVDTSFVGHSYYGSSDTVLADLFALIKCARSPDQRECLQPRTFRDGLKYWVFESKPMTAARPSASRLR